MKTKLRIAGHTIQKGAFISRDVIMKGNNRVGSNSKVGNNVVLEKNSSIGSNSSVDRTTLGENSSIESGARTTGHGNGKIIIGKESYIGVYNVLDWSNNITIGNYVHIAGPSTGLWTHTSAQMCLNGIPISDKKEDYRPTAPISIEDNVYIGGNCTIYPGITIGHHSIVAPNSAVTKNVESYTLVGGVPAKEIKKLK